MRRHSRTRAGIALLLALVVVVVLTSFLSELFLDTGLEVRAIENFRDSAQAQTLARSAFKAVEVALKQQPEKQFVFGFRQIASLMSLSSVPFESGLLTRLQVSSMDGLFNVNALGKIRPNTSESTLRWALFRNALAAIRMPSGPDGSTLPTPTDVQVIGLYSALVDWIDDDDTEYVDLGGRGAERRDYAAEGALYTIKNAPLDRLEEMRLVRGFDTIGLPWPEIENRFDALPSASAPKGGGSYLPEKLDLNLASREQLVAFLTEHRVDDPKVLNDATYGAVQKNINTLADQVDAVAAALVPDSGDRPFFDKVADAQNVMRQAGFSDVGALDPFFSTCSQFLRVRITVAVNGAQSTLDAQLQVTRDGTCGAASKLDIIRYTQS